MLRFIRILRAISSTVAGKQNDLFERYAEIDNTNDKRLLNLNQANIYDDEWIATEKVHGANFGIYSVDFGKQIRFAKRSGIMPPHEHFFGYHILLPELQQHAKDLRQHLETHVGLSLHTVIVNGELFGGKYNHPLVAKSKTTVMVAGKPRFLQAVQNDSFPQYSPHLHFYAFDLKYKETSSAEIVTLTFDEATSIFSKVSGLLFAKAIVRGPMSKIAAFNVETFETTIPNLVGMGNFPLKSNWAEGLVVKHSKRGSPNFDPKAPTILKIKSTAFQEISIDKNSGPRLDAMETVRTQSILSSGAQLPDMETAIQDPEQLQAAKHLTDHVCDNRLKNVLSKIGSEPFTNNSITPESLAMDLARDALKDFLKDSDAQILNAAIMTRREMVKYALFESHKLVHMKWDEIVKERLSDA